MGLTYASDTPVDGDAFVTSSISEPSNLIPFLATDSASHEITALIFNGLVKYDENLKIVGDLAENWEIKEDGLHLDLIVPVNARATLSLPPGFKMDGTSELTAERHHIKAIRT